MATDQVASILSTHTGILRGVVDRLDALGGGARPRAPQRFKSGAEFIQALYTTHGKRGQSAPDARILNLGTWSGERVGADGGYALQDDWAREVVMACVGQGSLVGAFDPLVTTSSIVRLAVDVEPDWSVNGITVEHTAEGGTITASKPSLKLITFTLEKTPGLVHADERLDRDTSGAFARYIWGCLARKTQDAVEGRLLRGTGMDQPLGILNSPGRVTVTPATSTASVVSSGDLRAMVGRLLPGGYPRAIWIVHSSALVALFDHAGTLYSPDAPSPFGLGRLLGRPVAVSEHCDPLGTAGGVALVDPAGVLVAVEGPRLAETIDFAFDQGLRSFRANLDMGCAPLLADPVARRTGSDTVSHIVTLGSRS